MVGVTATATMAATDIDGTVQTETGSDAETAPATTAGFLTCKLLQFVLAPQFLYAQMHIHW